MTLDDVNVENTLEPWHSFLIGKILSAYIEISYITSKIFLCPHSFLFNPIIIDVDCIGLFFCLRFLVRFPPHPLPPDETFEQG